MHQTQTVAILQYLLSILTNEDQTEDQDQQQPLQPRLRSLLGEGGLLTASQLRLSLCHAVCSSLAELFWSSELMLFSMCDPVLGVRLAPVAEQDGGGADAVEAAAVEQGRHGGQREHLTPAVVQVGAALTGLLPSNQPG